METSIKKWGNSQGLCIPRALLKKLEWEVNDPVEISVSGDKIVISRKSSNDIKADAFAKLKSLRISVPDFDADAELMEALEEKYGI